MNFEKIVKEFSEIAEVDPSKTNLQFGRKDKDLIRSVYKEIFGKVDFLRTNCRSCYVDAYIVLRKWLRENDLLKQSYQLKTKTMAEKQFTIKEGKRIMLFGVGTVYTNKNITDEKARELLSKYPKLISVFERYPSDWNAGPKKGAEPEGNAGNEGGNDEGTGKEFTAETYQEELEKSNKKQLQAICKANPETFGDEGNWSGLNKGDLVEYMVNQKFPA